MKKILTLLFLIYGCYAFSLTLKEAQNKALESNYGLKITENEYNQFRLDVYKAASGFLPTAEITSAYTKINDKRKEILGLPAFYENKSRSYGYNISYPLFLGGKTILGLAISGQAKDIAKLQLLSKKQETIVTATAKYLAVVEAKLLHNISKMELESTTLQYEKSKTRYNAGLISKAALLQMKSEMFSQRSSENQLKTLLYTSKKDLAQTLKIESNYEVQLNDLFDQKTYEQYSKISDDQQQDLNTLLIKIMKYKNQTLGILRKNIDVKRKLFYLETSNLLPQVFLQYSKSWDDYFASSDEFENQGSMLAIQASIPIFPLIDNGFDIAKARLETKKAHLEYDNTLDQLSISMNQLLSSIIGTSIQIQAQNMALDAALESYKKMTEMYEKNMISSTDLLQAKTMKKAAEMSLIQSKINFINSKMQIVHLLNIDEKEFDKIFDLTLQNQVRNYINKQ